MTASIWKPKQNTGGWNTAENWSPAEVPTDTAIFETAPLTVIEFSAENAAKVAQIEFPEGAASFTFLFGPGNNPSLTLTGQGVSNSSRHQQSFIVASISHGFGNPQLEFLNNASAGGDDVYYCAGPENEQGYGGGVICFRDSATAGSAFFKVWTGAGIPPKHSTVGGEVSFCDNTSAGTARFIIYGTLGTDGDTFGNVVFHQSASAADATFTNVGGTVAGGDGGNTQFYGNSSAANGSFLNWGGTHPKANGGDVAFDATADGGQGIFHNYAAKAEGAYGGVTSFNNNPPSMAAAEGTSAGQGAYFNYGAREGELGGGGHLEFSARYGSPTADQARIVNYGSVINRKSSAGHTIFSINTPTIYFPTAGHATIWNHPAESEQGAAGYTEFAVFGTGTPENNVPTAGNSTILNLGGFARNAAGGYTVFSGASTAGDANLIAYGDQDGYGGRIIFKDEARGGSARVQLFGHGELDLGYHTQGVTLGSLEMTGGLVSVQLDNGTVPLTISNSLVLHSPTMRFSFWKKETGEPVQGKTYTLLKNDHLAQFNEAQFSGNSVEGIAPVFSITGTELKVSFPG